LPITLSESSEPEPDIAVVRIDANLYRDRHPNPSDIFLLIEIADATLRRDRDHKNKLYAQADILEYWIVDVQNRQIIVFRNPKDGIYASQQIFTQTDLITPVAFPDLTVNLQNLLI
jgi:Uma2 family endonuclease